MVFSVSVTDGWQWLISDTLRNLHHVSSHSRQQIKVRGAGFPSGGSTENDITVVVFVSKDCVMAPFVH